MIGYGFRYYNPSTGRFITRDPIEEDGGLNLYGFVGNAPTNLIDPLGREVWDYSRTFTTGLAGFSKETDFQTLGITWDGSPKATCDSDGLIHVKYWVKAEVLSQAAIKLRNPSGRVEAMEKMAIKSEQEHIGDFERWITEVAHNLIQDYQEKCPCKCSHDGLLNLTNLLSRSVTEVGAETALFWDGRTEGFMSDFTANKNRPHYINGSGRRKEPSSAELRQHFARIDGLYEKYKSEIKCGTE